MTGETNLRAALELVDGLVGGGVSRAVVSPGSRSTPLAVACAVHPGIRVVPVLDERGAAFHALGMAAAADEPVLVVATSGSAPANWLPAVLEASHARVPLVLASASRPFDLVASDAPQSTDQDLFGRAVRLAVRLDAPAADGPGGEPWRRVGARAAAASRDPVPGPVHLDVPFRKPLLPPRLPPVEDALGRVPAAPGVGEVRVHPARRLPREEAVEALAARVRRARRPVLVAGPGPVTRYRELGRVAAFCRETGIPLLAEATSGWRFRGDRHGTFPAGDRFDLCWRHPAGRRALEPDLLLVVGLPPVSRGLADLLEGAVGVPLVVLAEHGWNDPWGRAVEVVAGAPVATLEALAGRLAGWSAEPAWSAAWATLDAAAERAEEILAAAEGGARPVPEARAVRATVAALPEGALLLAGNGLPVRELDLHVPGEIADLAVLHRRGQSGIEGGLAELAGAAAAWPGPALALLGDLAFRHDAGGLEVLARTEGTAVAVVLENGGGRIFDGLPVAGAGLPADAFETLFRCPGGADPVALAGAHGIAAERAEDEAAIEAAIAAALRRGGASVIAVPTDGDGIGERMRHLADLAVREAGFET